MQLVSKITKTISRPVRLKNALLNVISGVLDSSYQRGMLYMDRLLALPLVPLAEILARMPGKSRERGGIALWMYRYSGDVDQESIEKICLKDTLENYAGGYLPRSYFYWDSDRPVLGLGVDFYFKTIRLRPRVLVLSSYSTRVYYQPAAWLFVLLKWHGIKIVALWWDTCSESFAASVGKILDDIDVHVIMENPLLRFAPSSDGEKLARKSLVAFSPFDPMESMGPRDIDVAFFGQTGDYRGVRRKYLDYLLDSGVALYYSAYSKDQQCPQDRYYEILGRSRIGINFSRSVSGHQLKARVFEVMHSGAMLLEERNDQTAFYFTEGTDYVAFSSEEEMVEKIRYYLQHEEECLAIARSGYLKVRSRFTGKQFWEMLLLQ
jgi:hypothetical protein